jgi:hypothetical protein
VSPRKAPANSITTECVLLVEDIAKGEFVRRVRTCKNCKGLSATEPGRCPECGKRGYTVCDKVYVRQDYCRHEQKYVLDDTTDISRCAIVPKGTRLFVGFTY